jgi:hypothetical protein
MDDKRLMNYMVSAKLARILTTPVLVDEDVTLPNGTFIPAGSDMDSLDSDVLDALELYYWSHDPTENCDLG